jgi:F-type H+-transporting ATPase subunit epsilon
MAQDKLEVHVVTPEREVWSGDADMVVATAVGGQLGILPGHAPLLAQLAIGPLEVVQGGRRERAAVDGGFLHVFADRVDVLAEFAETASEIDVSREQARRDDAQRRLAEGADERAREDLARATTRLRVAEAGR